MKEKTEEVDRSKEVISINSIIKQLGVDNPFGGRSTMQTTREVFEEAIAWTKEDSDRTRNYQKTKDRLTVMIEVAAIVMRHHPEQKRVIPFSICALDRKTGDAMTMTLKITLQNTVLFELVGAKKWQ